MQSSFYSNVSQCYEPFWYPFVVKNNHWDISNSSLVSEFKSKNALLILAWKSLHPGMGSKMRID